LDSSDQSFETKITNLSTKIRCISIDPSTFNHGLTRQFALNYCNGNYIVYTVQDAVPVGKNWLRDLLQPMIENNDLVAICGQQIILEDKAKNPVQWFRPIDKPEIRIIQISPDEYNKKSPSQRRELTRWDNVNACYKKEVLEKFPFANLNFGEDAFWADQALKNGLNIAYTGYAQVNHYHHYDNIQQLVRRIIAENLILKKTYDLDPSHYKINVRYWISILKSIVLSKTKLKEKFYWIVYNVKLEIALYLAQKTWNGFTSIVNAENYICKNIPHSIKNGRN
jgi:GT2 family glycosyltransferase